MSLSPKTPPEIACCKGSEAAADLARLHALCFPKSPWPTDSCRDTLQAPGTHLFLHPEGFLLLRQMGDEAEILSLGVAPSARKQGLGHRLVQATETFAYENSVETLFLEVSEDNTAALALYRSHGFVEIARRKGYYTRQGHGEDAILMNKNLSRKQ